MDLKPVLRAVLAEYELPWSGLHGVAHWARVLENGRCLCGATNANPNVVALFAVLHDSKRVTECSDPDHGARAAESARQLVGTAFQLPEADLRLLCRACEGHTHELTHPDPTIQTCWDADRLDLGRVGVTPHPSRLCTAAARQPETIRWADGRASFHFIPNFVVAEWGINLENQTWQVESHLSSAAIKDTRRGPMDQTPQ